MEHNTENQLSRLIESEDQNNLILASQLIKGLGSQEKHLALLVKKVALKNLNIYLPDTDYHRFGPSIMGEDTYQLIYKKLNEIIAVDFMEVLVCAEYLQITAYVLMDTHQPLRKVQVEIDDFSDTIFYSLSAQFGIGNRPQNI